MKKLAILAIVAALGLAAATGFTAKPASAYDISHLPAGYTLQHIVTSSSGPCSEVWIISGYGTGSGQLCADSPSFQADVDAFVTATCPVTVCVPPPAPTTTTTTADTPPTTTDAQPFAPTTTVTVTETVTDPTIEQRLTALEQRQTVDEARLATIEAQLGIIVPEAKNQSPFTDPV